VHDPRAFDALYREVEPENVVTAVAADKGYDSDAIRLTLSTDGIEPVIPARANRKQPAAYDRRIYRERNRVERFFNKLKHFRRIATRYDKLAKNFLALLQLVSAFIFARNS
jgi:transposase